VAIKASELIKLLQFVVRHNGDLDVVQSGTRTYPQMPVDGIAVEEPEQKCKIAYKLSDQVIIMAQNDEGWESLE